MAQAKPAEKDAATPPEDTPVEATENDTAVDVEPVEAPLTAGAAGALTAALANAQAQFPSIPRAHTAEVKNKQTGSLQYTYTYADLADVLGAVRPVLARNGLALVQRTVRENDRVVLVTELRHVAGGVLSSEVDLGRDSRDAQQFGGALTYLRRYSVVTLLGIAAEEDRDAQDVEPAGARPAPAPLPGWALEASIARKKQWVEELAPYIGDAHAAGLAAGLVGAWGHFPDGATAIASAITKAIDAGLRPYGLQIALDDAAQARKADLAAAQEEAPQDAGEPDVPGDVPNDVPPAEDPVEPPPADDPPTSTDVAPGSVLVPQEALENSGAIPARRIAVLREAGCICEDPLGREAGRDPAGISDKCPVNGHGIPF